MSAISQRVRIFSWFSWSHWGMFREPLMTCPEIMTWGMQDVDDEDIEYIPRPGERIVPHEDCLNCRCTPEQWCAGVKVSSTDREADRG